MEICIIILKYAVVVEIKAKQVHLFFCDFTPGRTKVYSPIIHCNKMNDLCSSVFNALYQASRD